MSQEKERRDVMAYAESLGWRVIENGYAKMLCPCGKHKKWLRLTPSNPNYWNETKRYLDRVCPKNRKPEKGGESKR